MSSETLTPFAHWAILELMGHRRIAGYVQEAELFGGKLLRIDVPGKDDEFSATQYYGSASIYGLTPTTEEVARAVARSNVPQPVHEWEIHALPERPELDDEPDPMEDL